MADEVRLRQYLKKVTAELQQTRRQLSAAEAKASEPIAIVGMACRYPGGIRSPEDLWEFLAADGDAITEVPRNRGWDAAGPLDGLPGGFLSDPGEFDPEFFGITSDEALAMDPQHRLLLQTAWEAFESAGVVPRTAQAASTAVYVGLSWTGYLLQLRSAPPPRLQDHLTLGNALGAASGRISYSLGLYGAAVSVDTGCSSSLVATHLASQALRRGDCDLALAGGVSVIPIPHTLFDFRRRGTVAADGRSKSFAAAADGVSLGEGAGMLLLERVADARRHGHRVLAVIRGSAVNQDGASNGMESPSGPAQERLIRQALAAGGLTGAQVDVMEGHGIGATLGDPIEARALMATYGRDRPAGHPLWLGSIKSNIGHALAAGGVAGVIKLIMALRHGMLPRTLHVDRPTEHVDWSSGSIRLLTEPRPWVRDGHPRRGGVSCFTVTGTNAHVIVEEAAEDETPQAASQADGQTGQNRSAASASLPWLISARSAGALRHQAANLLELAGRSPAGGADGTDADLGFSLATTRTVHMHRAVIVADTRAGFLAGLTALVSDQASPAVVTGTAQARGKLALLFSAGGPGTPEHVPGTSLRDCFVPFAEAFDRVSAELGSYVAAPDADAAKASSVLASELALFRLLRAFGISPDYVIGLGTGEIAAACAAGVLSLPDAGVLITALARLRRGGSLDDFRGAFGTLTFTAPAIPTAAGADALSAADYWIERADSAGNFTAGIRRLRDEGVNRCLELGPGQACTDLAYRALISTGKPGRALVLAHAASPRLTETAALLTALGELHADGVRVDWSPAFAGHRVRAVPLPAYPFRSRSFWLGTGATAGATAAPPPADAAHPLLGAEVALPGAAERRFAGTIAAPNLAWVAGHRLLGTAVLPAAALLEWFLAAARRAGDHQDTTTWTLDGVTFAAPVPVPAAGLAVHAVAGTDGDRIRIRCLAGTTGKAGEWDEPVTAATVTPAVPARPAPTDLGALRERLSPRDATALYELWWQRGLECDPPLRALRQLWQAGGEALGLVEADDTEPGAAGYLLRPVLLEACLRLSAACSDDLVVPVAADRVIVHEPLPGRVWCHAVSRGGGVADLTMLSDSGHTLAEVTGMRWQPASAPVMAALAAAPLRWHELHWQPLPRSSACLTVSAGPGSRLLFGDDAAQIRRWRAELDAVGLPAVGIIAGTGTDSDGEFYVDTDDEADVRRLFATLSAASVKAGGLVLCPSRAPERPGAGLGAILRPGIGAALVLKHYLKEQAGSGAQLVICSVGAASPCPDDQPPVLSQTMLTALAKAVSYEHPEVDCAQVDLGPGTPPPSLVRVLGHVARLSGAGHLAVRDGRWFEARLRETDLPPVDPPSLSPRASYLISGGSAETAAEFARRLGELGTRSLLLTGQPRPAAEPPQFAALRAGGATVRWCEQGVPSRPPDVDGVLFLAEPPHDDQGLLDLDPAKFRQLLERQLRDAWQLHGAVGDTGFFIVSPDITALTGCAGHVGMLAAAAILDGMARHHPGGSTVARGPSAGTGTDTRFLAQGGIYPVDARRLADAMPWPLTGRPAPGGLARLDRDRLIAITGRSRPYTLLSTADEREGGTPGFGQHRMTAYRHNEESGRSGPD